MKIRKWFGFTESKDSVSKGALAYFCPACPQVGVNIEPDWKDDPNRYVIVTGADTWCYGMLNRARWVYCRTLNADGCFSHEHIKNKGGEDDVELQNGCGFMVATGDYQTSLRHSFADDHV